MVFLAKVRKFYCRVFGHKYRHIKSVDFREIVETYWAEYTDLYRCVRCGKEKIVSVRAYV